jgi:hypothetical protein
MSAWPNDELATIGAADELQIAGRRRDGTLRNPVIIWVVRHGDDLYVRSVNGRSAAWFRGTQVRHEGRIWAGGIEQDVAFVDVDPAAEPDLTAALDAAFRTKYGHYEAQYVDPMVVPTAQAATLKLVPRAVD